jgi:hypothetical protein
MIPGCEKRACPIAEKSQSEAWNSVATMASKLSIYERMFALSAIFAVTFVGFSLASYHLHQRFAVLAIAVPASCGLVMTLSKCPRCGWPIFKKRTRHFEYWGGAIPEACLKCGLSFTHREHETGPHQD